MRKHGSIIASILAAACLFSVGCKKEQTIKVATQSPLSDDTKEEGIDIKNGAQLALEQLSSGLAEMGIKVELTPFDDQGDPKKGIENAKTIGTPPRRITSSSKSPPRTQRAGPPTASIRPWISPPPVARAATMSTLRTILNHPCDPLSKRLDSPGRSGGPRRPS